jgi:sigma-B regulation protein RsbU (phosphoserine phosphatase)
MDPAEAHRALLTTLRRAFSTHNYAYAEASTIGLPTGEFRITRVWHGNGAEGVAPNSPWRISNVPIRCGGFLPQIFARKTPSIVRDLSIAPDDPVYPELGRYHSLMTAPSGGGVPDNWTFLLDEGADTFDTEYLENFVLRVGLIGAMLNNLQILHDLRRATSYIDSEIDRIAGIQRALLPADVPEAPGLDVAALSETFDRAGGDLYNYTEISNGRWAFLIADASGHGPSAAVVAAMLIAILHAYCPESAAQQTEARPDKVLNFANAQLADTHIESSFVTAFLAIWNPVDRTFTYTRAGHNPPMLRKASGEIIELQGVGNLPLGMFPETRYENRVVKLEPGDIVLMYTDGLIDAANQSGENFGEDRLRAVLKTSAPSAADLVTRVRQAIQDYVARTCPRDDQTMMVLRVL